MRRSDHRSATAKRIAVADLYYLGAVCLVILAHAQPFPFLKRWLASLLGAGACLLSLRKRAAMQRALAVAYHELPRLRRWRILWGASRGVWAEMLAWKPNEEERMAVEAAVIEGGEHLKAALGRGRGVILWESNGFGSRALSKQILALHRIRVHQVRGPNHLGSFLVNDANATRVRRWVQHFFDRCEAPFVAGAIDLPLGRSLGFARRLKQLLAANAVVCSTGDGKVGRRFLPVSFLGSREPFATGMVTLARQQGSTILPIFCWPDGHGRLILRFEPPVPLGDGGDRDHGQEVALTCFARALETAIRHRPELFRNWHLLSTSRPEEATRTLPS